MAASEDTSVKFSQFDQTDHPTDVYDAFNEFVASIQYKYQSWTKEPPSTVAIEAIPAWNQQNKRNFFLGRCALRNLQWDFEDLTALDQRDTIGFDAMVKLLNSRYLPTKNSTLQNIQFHSLKQEDGEAFDTFVNRVKHEAAACDFKCSHADCTVADVVTRVYASNTSK